MRILVLGGTRFLGHAVAAEAVGRGHDVVCAARGESGAAPEGARLVVVDRDVEDGLAPLAGERFDAVVDVATISHEWVRRALAAFGADAAHWTFVSSISVYRDTGSAPGGIDDPVHEPRAEHGSREKMADDPDSYGAIKVASEQTVREVVGGRELIVRAGLITGPGDVFDRLGYWVQRIAAGGRVVVPDTDQRVQHIDVRDLAAWIVGSAETGTTGTYDAIGPHVPLLDLLAEIATTLDADVEFVRVDPAKLAELEVAPWAGPHSLPLWLPDTYANTTARDAAPVIAAGLAPRPFAETVTAVLANERALGLDRARVAGMTRAEEAAILDAL
ncbi:epimerase [Actinokineospora auranticolor]|uniref:Nucleoside-diphosphate-sugar epimerase n=1 Tax=Actinokineospora auranticolor TaxID=155976 RepID=A0A2S6GRP2_9PSEU|nr:NAD-dependent epimerase/dehydratase family protein [Actinokineospora auranticolor]PPK67843.1 nucleoside-diphosphate-sugar epimerase [Actinokineospora auranticolor]